MYIEKLVVKLDLEILENNTDRFKIKFIKLYDDTEVIDEIEINNRTKDSDKFEFTGSEYTISNKIHT
jgi:desulfoferrodoxin (superoxide reductase-like protein)